MPFPPAGPHTSMCRSFGSSTASLATAGVEAMAAVAAHASASTWPALVRACGTTSDPLLQRSSRDDHASWSQRCRSRQHATGLAETRESGRRGGQQACRGAAGQAVSAATARCDVQLLGVAGSSGQLVARELAASSLSVRLAGRRLEPLTGLASELAASGAAVDSAAIQKWCRRRNTTTFVASCRGLGGSAWPAGEIEFLAPTRERRTT